MSASLFAYGTLEDAATLARFVATAAPGERALLRGYARYRVRGADYPGVLARPGSTTMGTLYHDLSPEAFARLDAYEGSLYERVMLPVERGQGGVTLANVYVVPASRAQALTAEPWPARTR